jgi:hypothetical protein
VILRGNPAQVFRKRVWSDLPRFLNPSAMFAGIEIAALRICGTKQ